MKNIRYFKIILDYLKNDKLFIILFIIVNILKNILPLFVSIMWANVIDNITTNQQFNFIIFVCIYSLFCIINWALFDLISNLIYNRLEKKFISSGQKDLYKKMINLPAIAYEEMGVGELNNRLNNDLERIISLLNRIINIASQLIMAFVFLIYSFLTSWILGIEFLIVCVIMYFLANIYYPKIKKDQEEIAKEGDKLAKSATEDFNGIREIKALGIKNNVSIRIEKIIDKLTKKQKDISKTEYIYYSINDLLYFIFYAVVIITVGILVFNNRVTLSIFFVISTMFSRMELAIEQISDFGVNYNKVIVSLKRIDEIINNKRYEDEKYGNIEINDEKVEIKFDNVTFKYREEEDNVLNSLNIKIEPNKKIAIVGKSGQGKSTIFNLLMRYFDATKGKIFVNNIDIKELTEESLRNNISIIRQNPYIFNQSIINNFKMIKENITLEEIRMVCKKAYIDDYIMSLPKKYNTIIGEGGINLSGGQKQRLAIARTLLKDTKVILFDEATSALDNESQNYIKKTIDELVKDHTIVIVAHRLSTIMDADKIFLLNKGKVVASGNHNELIKTSKLYKRLYNPEILDKNEVIE